MIEPGEEWASNAEGTDDSDSDSDSDSDGDDDNADGGDTQKVIAGMVQALQSQVGHSELFPIYAELVLLEVRKMWSAELSVDERKCNYFPKTVV